MFPSRRRHTRCSRDWSSDVCSPDLLHGRVRVIPLAVAQLAPAVVTPAVGDARGGEPAAVISAEGADGREAERAGDQRWRRAVRPGAVTQLTVEARAPTVPVPCRHDAAAVERAGADLRERVAALDGQGHRAAADHDTETGARLGRRRAELAAVVVAPAVRGVVTSEAAHMPIADAECAELEVARHENGRGATRLRAAQRSEERRVGKECRSRWSPYH